MTGTPFASGPSGLPPLTDHRAQQESQREALKRVGTTLKAAGLRFALAGSYAAWARGADEGCHDVDFAVSADDLASALHQLEQAGLDVLDAPEDWLAKVATDGVVVDLIHRLPQGPVDEALLGRADVISVASVRLPVLAATDLLVAKLLALGEHHCDLGPPLRLARALREQVDWPALARSVRGHTFAEAALVLLTGLQVAPAGTPQSGPTERPDPAVPTPPEGALA